MDDLKIRMFRQDLVNYINSVELPIEVKRLVVGEIQSLITKESEMIIRQQIENQKGETENES